MAESPLQLFEAVSQTYAFCYREGCMTLIKSNAQICHMVLYLLFCCLLLSFRKTVTNQSDVFDFSFLPIHPSPPKFWVSTFQSSMLHLSWHAQCFVLGFYGLQRGCRQLNWLGSRCSLKNWVLPWIGSQPR